MSEKKNGGAAFPLYGVTSVVQEGMTLRDYFAAKAMQGLVSDPVTLAGISEVAKKTRQEDDGALAHAAYVIADAMLAERAK